MESSFDLVLEVQPGREAWRIKVRVLRIWEVPSFLNPTQANSVEMVLIDEKIKIKLYVMFCRCPGISGSASVFLPCESEADPPVVLDVWCFCFSLIPIYSFCSTRSKYAFAGSLQKHDRDGIHLIHSWIINSVSDSIAQTLVFHENAIDAWEVDLRNQLVNLLQQANLIPSAGPSVNHLRTTPPTECS
ncbi:hypothetical protein TSUD_193820 [Trifolium subterraneum]|uniref:Uncharacterized protein n=1 Tax=Trifolium subterraneum TaxID=3900 RepID=A0A2Z6MS45_TRISU|nr:hypothetical protein TSUD_193820 [Trifolium subterraneum]